MLKCRSQLCRRRNPPLQRNIDRKHWALNSIIYDYFVLSIVGHPAKFFTPIKYSIPFYFQIRSFAVHFKFVWANSIAFNKANRFFFILIGIAKSKFSLLMKNSGTIPLTGSYCNLMYLSLCTEKHAIKSHLKLVKEYCFIRR